MILRDYPRASELYKKLEKTALTANQPEYQAWAYMQTARINYLSRKFKEAASALALFQTKDPYRKAACAPYALLRLGVAEYNYLHDRSRAEKVFSYIADKFPQTTEAKEADFYLSMIPVLENEPANAISLLQKYLTKYPNNSSSSSHP